MPEITQEELDKYKGFETKVTDLQTTNTRLEAESTKVKTRAQVSEQKVSDLEKQKLEDDGDIQKRLDVEIEENVKLKADNVKRKSDTMTDKLRTAISAKCPNLQPGALDLVLQVKEHKGLLKIDSEAETVEGVDDFVAKVKETHAFFFSDTKIPDTDNLPPGSPPKVENLTDNEKYAKELGECNTQADFDKVRKKYNRA